MSEWRLDKENAKRSLTVNHASLEAVANIQKARWMTVSQISAEENVPVEDVTQAVKFCACRPHPNKVFAQNPELQQFLWQFSESVEHTHATEHSASAITLAAVDECEYESVVDDLHKTPSSSQGPGKAATKVKGKPKARLQASPTKAAKKAVQVRANCIDNGMSAELKAGLLLLAQGTSAQTNGKAWLEGLVGQARSAHSLLGVRQQELRHAVAEARCMWAHRCAHAPDILPHNTRT